MTRKKNNEGDPSDKPKKPKKSDRSDKSDKPDRLIPKHGGYEQLRSYQCARLIYARTIVFCDRFIDKDSRTHDQMVQAARSGVRNISEGSMASATSKKIELKLTGIARASLSELLEDYVDFLRHRKLPLWPKDSAEALAVRGRHASVENDPFEIETASASVAANTLICLIHQATYLLRRQLDVLEQEFLEHGGFTEKLYSARSRQRQEPTAPVCPKCGGFMVRRTARTGRRAGESFWGCSTYPQCRGTRPVE